MNRLHTASVVALAASLAACVVVPIDPRTGQPYPLPPADGGRTTVVMPPVPAAAPSPSVITARLYPLNEPANQSGMLSAVIVDIHTGRGEGIGNADHNLFRPTSPE